MDFVAFPRTENIKAMLRQSVNVNFIFIVSVDILANGIVVSIGKLIISKWLT